MKRLNSEEMINIKGGAISFKVAALVGGAIVFIVGVIDGLLHPKKCE